MMLKVGLNKNVSIDEYHNEKETYSNSSIVAFANKGPLKFDYERKNPPKISTQKQHNFDIGNAVHTLVLEPEKYKHRFVTPPDTLPKSKNSKKYQEWAKENSDKIILSEEDDLLVRAMSDSVLSRKSARKYLTGGWSEYSFAFDHPAGIRIKYRPDHIPFPGSFTNLKTHMSWGNKDICTSIYDMKYHWGAYISKKGAEFLTGKHHDYFFVIVDKEPPHDVKTFRCDDELLEIARIEVEPVIESLAECHKTNTWPGHPDEVQSTVVPEWLRRKYFLS
jgi:hypothetical protein